MGAGQSTPDPPADAVTPDEARTRLLRLKLSPPPSDPKQRAVFAYIKAVSVDDNGRAPWLFYVTYESVPPAGLSVLSQFSNYISSVSYGSRAQALYAGYVKFAAWNEQEQGGYVLDTVQTTVAAGEPLWLRWTRVDTSGLLQSIIFPAQPPTMPDEARRMLQS